METEMVNAGGDREAGGSVEAVGGVKAGAGGEIGAGGEAGAGGSTGGGGPAGGCGKMKTPLVDYGRPEADILAGILKYLREELVEPNLQEKDIDTVLESPFREVRNLMWIKRNAVYSVALEEWDRKEKLLTSRVDKKEKRSGILKNEIYQLVGFFSVFQGVVLTAVTQLTQSSDEFHNCKRVWSPVVLTALAWACVIVGVWQKFSRIQVIDDERFEEDEARREAVKRAQLLRNLGDRFKFRDLREKQKADPPKLYWNFSRHFWINRFGVVVVMLSFFTGIFIASYFLILCNRGLAPIDPSDAPAHS